MRPGTTVSIVAASVLLGVSPPAVAQMPAMQMPGMQTPTQAPQPSMPEQPAASASPAVGGG